MKIAYVKYSDPKPFSVQPSGTGLDESVRVVFRVAGIVVREDEEFVVLGEVSYMSDNNGLAQRFGQDMFPAYRNILPIRRTDIVELRTVDLEEAPFGGKHSEETGVR